MLAHNNHNFALLYPKEEESSDHLVLQLLTSHMVLPALLSSLPTTTTSLLTSLGTRPEDTRLEVLQAWAGGGCQVHRCRDLTRPWPRISQNQFLPRFRPPSQLSTNGVNDFLHHRESPSIKLCQQFIF